MTHQVTVLFWNIQTIGDKKLAVSAGATQLLDLIAKVISISDPAIVGICEVLSNKADDLGNDLIDLLNHNEQGTPWLFHHSKILGGKKQKNRKERAKGKPEQYLFLWDSRLVTADTAQFKHRFLDPQNNYEKIGFPRKRRDRPPYLGRFHHIAANKPFGVAITHSPFDKLDAIDASRNLSRVQELRVGTETCVLLGDLNIRSDAAATATKQNGGKAFGALTRSSGTDPAMTQLLLDNGREVYTSLRAVATAEKVVQSNTALTPDYLRSAPYDQVFVRANPNLPNNNADLQDLMVEISTSLPDGAICPASIAKELGLLAKAIDPTQKVPPAGFATLDDAFPVFRRHVSDHLPVIADVQIA